MSVRLHPRSSGYHSLLGSSWGIGKSTDGGMIWVRIDMGLPLDYNFVSLALETAAPSTLYSAYIDYQTGVGGIFKSTDGGTSWQAANAGPNIIETTALAADPVNPASVYVAAGYDGIFKTVDHGANWKGLAALQISTAFPNGYTGERGCRARRSSFPGGRFSSAECSLYLDFLLALFVDTPTICCSRVRTAESTGATWPARLKTPASSAAF